MRNSTITERHIDNFTLPPILFDTLQGDGSDYRVIRSPLAITRKLEEILRHRLQVRLNLFRDGDMIGVYFSSIQKIDCKRRQVILHQLNPNSWRTLVTSSTPVAVSCYLPSGHVVFDTLIEPLEDSPNNPYCLLEFPACLHLQQLRASYRVALMPNTTELELRIGNHTIKGRCLDLSLNGCRGLFGPQLNELLADNEMPTRGWKLRLIHERNELLLSDAKINRCKQEAAGFISAGLQFNKTDTPHIRILQPLLLALQRQRIRQLPQLD